jgi:hypothetical protein
MLPEIDFQRSIGSLVYEFPELTISKPDLFSLNTASFSRLTR